MLAERTKMNDLKHLEENNYAFDINAYLKGAWARFKPELGPLVGVNILVIVGSILLSIIPLIGQLNGLVSTILYAGFYIYLRKAEQGNHEGKDFFGGFHFVLPIILYRIVLFLLIVPLLFLAFSNVIPTEVMLELLNGERSPMEVQETISTYMLSITNIQSMGIFAALTVSIYLLISFSFTIPLIVDQNLSFWPAMELSRKTVGKKFFSFLIFWIVFGGLIGIATLLTFGLALLFVLPFIYTLLFEMYDQIFLEEKKPLNHE